MGKTMFPMRIVAVADIHSEMYQTEKLLSLIEDKNADLIVVAGDLTKFGPVKAAYDILETLEKSKRKVVAVAGNEDNKEVEKLLKKRELDIHNKSVIHGKVGFVGFSGPTAISIGGVPILNYDTVNYTLAELKGVERKVLVSHVPPKDTKVDALFSGHHVGSEFLRDLIEDHQPDLVICGHIHESRGVDKIGKTTIINPGALCDGYAAFIEIKEDGSIEHELLTV